MLSHHVQESQNELFPILMFAFRVTTHRRARRLLGLRSSRSLTSVTAGPRPFGNSIVHYLFGHSRHKGAAVQNAAGCKAGSAQATDGHLGT